MRKFHSAASPAVKSLLEGLIRHPSPEPEEYRHLMTQLGEELGKSLGSRLDPSSRLLLICTNEDADFLARGVLTGLSGAGFDRLRLACFWNDRIKLGWGQDVAPITRRYVEPIEDVDTFVVVKSIISSSCVVRTLITELVHRLKPEQIEIVAPVLFEGAQERLAEEFELTISHRFHYTWFAEDDERTDDGTVLPGIGGSVYELLGIGTEEDKARFTPEIVKQRRKEFASH